MQRFSATYVAVILFFALAAYMMFFRTMPEAEPFPVYEEDLLYVYEVDEADVIGFRVEPDGLRVYRDEQGQWQVDAEFSVRLDDSRISMLGTMVTPLQANRIVVDDPPDLSVYGLDEPWQRLIVNLKDGSEITVEFGSQSPVGGVWYARVTGDTRIFTVPDHRIAGLGWGIDELRSVWVTEFEPADVQEYVVYEGGRSFVRFQRLSIDDWQMTRPWKTPVDRGEVEDYLRLFRFLRSEECVAEQPDSSDLEQWGLDEPEYTFTATLHDGAIFSVYIGVVEEIVEDEEGEQVEAVVMYAMNDHEPSVHLIQPLREFVQPMDTFLVQRLVPFWRTDIEQLAVVTGQAYWSDRGPSNLTRDRATDLTIKNPNFGRELDLLTVFISIHASGYVGTGKVPAISSGSGPYPAVEFTYRVSGETEPHRLVFVKVGDLYYCQPPGYTVGIWSSGDEIDRVVKIVFDD